MRRLKAWQVMFICGWVLLGLNFISQIIFLGPGASDITGNVGLVKALGCNILALFVWAVTPFASRQPLHMKILFSLCLMIACIFIGGLTTTLAGSILEGAAKYGGAAR